MTMLECHSSDLTAACLRYVQLRREGKAIMETTSALYRGSLWGRAVQLAHQTGLAKVDSITATFLTGDAATAVQAEADAEGRPLSDATRRNADATTKEVSETLLVYCARFAHRFSEKMGRKLIGCEVPIRAEIDGAEYASHLDILYAGPNGYEVYDDKWRDEQPTMAYLARALQLPLYALMVRYGAILVDPDLPWSELGEWPDVFWVHAPNIQPYKRAGTRSEGGNDVAFKAGDPRPEHAIFMRVPFDPSQEQTLRDELAMRQAMFAAGHYPTNPDPVGCHICAAKVACPSFERGTHANE